MSNIKAELKEKRDKRVTRLKTRKQQLTGEIKALKATPGRNSGHKITMKKAEVDRVDAKIGELGGKKP
jgi:peptidoglycan hydrolase CwlO-like protein